MAIECRNNHIAFEQIFTSQLPFMIMLYPKCYCALFPNINNILFCNYTNIFSLAQVCLSWLTMSSELIKGLSVYFRMDKCNGWQHKGLQETIKYSYMKRIRKTKQDSAQPWMVKSTMHLVNNREYNHDMHNPISFLYLPQTNEAFF